MSHMFFSVSLGGFSEIKNNYDRSTNASKTVDESDDTVKSSAENRQDVNNLTNKFQPANTEDLNRLNQHIGTQPDLTPVAKKVKLILLDDVIFKFTSGFCDLQLISSSLLHWEWFSFYYLPPATHFPIKLFEFKLWVKIIVLTVLLLVF